MLHLRYEKLWELSFCLFIIGFDFIFLLSLSLFLFPFIPSSSHGIKRQLHSQRNLIRSIEPMKSTKWRRIASFRNHILKVVDSFSWNQSFHSRRLSFLYPPFNVIIIYSNCQNGQFIQSYISLFLQFPTFSKAPWISKPFDLSSILFHSSILYRGLKRIQTPNDVSIHSKQKAIKCCS
jgi:hypothetical protein